jgi:hypothetical protein
MIQTLGGSLGPQAGYKKCAPRRPEAAAPQPFAMGEHRTPPRALAAMRKRCQRFLSLQPCILLGTC